MSDPKITEPEDDLTTEELMQHLEWGGWSAMVLIPIIYSIQGPSVSRDQFVVRTVLAVVVYAGTPVLWWLRRRRAARTSDEPELP